MKTAVVTGASGFIGKSLTNRLLTEGWEVYAVVRNKEKLSGICQTGNLHIIEADFERYPQLPQLIGTKNPDVFFHMAWAGYGKATNDYSVQIQNVKYTCDAITAAADIGSRKFIFADSSHEYLKNHYNNDPTYPPSFCSVYGAAKQSARQMCQIIAYNRGMSFNGVIFTNVFGVGDMSQRSANTIIKKLLSGEAVDLIKGEHLYDWTYVDDVVGGVLAAAQKGRPNQVYYVGSKTLRPFREIITEVRDILAPCVQLNFGKFDDTSYIDYSLINIFQLYEDTGYLPICDFRESVLKTAEWLKSLNAQ